MPLPVVLVPQCAVAVGNTEQSDKRHITYRCESSKGQKLHFGEGFVFGCLSRMRDFYFTTTAVTESGARRIFRCLARTGLHPTDLDVGAQAAKY